MVSQTSLNTPPPQSKAFAMSPPYTHALGHEDGSASHPLTNRANHLDIEDETCFVCTTKCTCTNQNKSNTTLAMSATSSTTSNFSPTSTGIADPFTDSVPPSSSAHPSLKIKLTLPSSFASAYSPSTPKSSHSRGLPHKKKSRNAGGTMFVEGNGGGPSSSQTFQVSAPSSAGRSSSMTAGSGPSSSALKKKRGRPPKASDRPATRMQPLSGGTTNFSDAGHHTDPRIAPITHVTASRPQSKKITTDAKGKANANANKLARKLQGSAQSRRAGGSSQVSQRKKIIHVLDDESSELSELDDEDNLESYGLPTFVTALSSSNSSSSSDSGSSESEVEVSFDSQSESSKGSSRGSRDNSPHGDDVISERKRGYRCNWNMRMRRRESGSVGLSDADMDSTDSDILEAEGDAEDMGEGNDNEEEIEDLGYPQLARYSGIATGWTDDEGENSFDAELFFANLSETDTSAYVSDDEQMGDAENGFGDEDGQDEEEEMDAMDVELGFSGVDVVRLSEMAAAGFLAPFSDVERSGAAPSWDQLVSSSIRDQLPNLDARQAREAYLSSTLEMTVPGYKEAEAMMATSEEEEAVAMFDNDDCLFDQDFADEDGLEIDGSDEGDTTEDEFVDVDGIATPRRDILLRFPASLGAIDPMSTVSSPIRPISKPRHKKAVKLSELNSVDNKEQCKPKKEARKPSEILSGKVFEDSEKENFDTSSSPRAPPMGSFIHRPSEVPTRAVIAAHGSRSERSIPSPYPATRRARRARGGSLSAISHSGSDRSFLSRPSSFLSARRSPYEPSPSVQPCIDETEDTDTQMQDSIRLDDVFDTTFLEPATSDAAAPPDSGSTMQSFETDPSDTERGLHRWDRVPINAFRKSRQPPTGAEIGLTERAVITRTPHAPRPSDGFSYGSATGGMLRGSPLTPSLWETMGSPTIKNEQARAAALDKMSLLLSPVLLPPRDDNKTPTPTSATNGQCQKEQEDEQQLLFGYETHTRSGQSQNNHQQHHAANLKTRKEMRKEKKRNKKFVGGPPPHSRHNHFPNARGRASGSMQRSASVPSLSL